MSPTASSDSGPSVEDIDGNIYAIVKIGNQWWMMENLKVTHYCNGNPIPNVTDNQEWSILSTGAYCDYDNKPQLAEIYGRLYNSYAITDKRGIAPTGWHVAMEEDFVQMEVEFFRWALSEAYSEVMRGSTEGAKMKTTGTIEDGTGLWHSLNTDATNETRFSALSGGWRNSNGLYESLGYMAFFWSLNKSWDYYPIYRFAMYNYPNFNRHFGRDKYGISIRCVRN